MAQKKDIHISSNKEEALLERYLNEISIYSPLSDNEEKELSERIKANDKTALDKLINSNLKFVVSIARQYVTEGVSMLDLINEGNTALIFAAMKFDPSRGERFSNYAVWDIRKAIEDYLPAEDAKYNRTVGDNLPNDSLVADGAIEDITDRMELLELIHQLPERERVVLKAYFGVGSAQMTMAEIGTHYNMKRERVRQIRNRAMRRLRTLKK